MKIKLIRYSANKESTLGILLVDDVFFCYTLEDEHREQKVMHETRIPDGTYNIILAKGGGHHERYTKLYPDMHKGMLLLQDVPGFQGILIHTGNTDDHTSGCILVGNTTNNNKLTDGHISQSVDAYKKVYPIIAAAIEKKEPVTIEVTNIEKL
jgi:hypothetical protein